MEEEVSRYFVGGNGFEARAPGVGRVFYPAGTFIDDSLAQFAHLVGQGPPVDAMPYDQISYDFMLRSPAQGGMGYPYYAVRPFGAGIVLSGPGTGRDYWAQHPIP
jgi:hypothetical protein